jgi:hypothetical protein
MANRPPVQLQWDGWLRPRDEPAAVATGGSDLQPDGDGKRLVLRVAYAMATGMVVISCSLSALTNAHDVSWRMATPNNLWEPVLWNAISGIVILALLPLTRMAALLILASKGRLVALGLAAAIALGFAFSTLHIVGMGLLREFAYSLGGWSDSFPWGKQFPYEMRKDLLAYVGLVMFFLLAERFTIVTAKQPDKRPDVSERPAPTQELWLRDGRTSVLIDPTEIVAVTSAGNYVEYRLTANRTHLVRATLQTQEDRLAPLGIVRVHRTRLINLKRIVALEWRQSGDFEVRLDTGETVACSRRFKTAVAHLAA